MQEALRLLFVYSCCSVFWTDKNGHDCEVGTLLAKFQDCYSPDALLQSSSHQLPHR